MAPKSPRRQSLKEDLTALRVRAEKAEELLRAIRSGEVDALVIDGKQGRQVYTLKGADHNYRVLMDNISEGALTLAQDGMILFCNRQFAEMVRMPAERVITKNIKEFIASSFQSSLETLLQSSQREPVKTELLLVASNGNEIPAAVSVIALPASEDNDLCMAVTNLQERREAALQLRQKQDELDQSRKLEAVGRLAGGVAHDFNNLMTGIVGLAQDVKASFSADDERAEDLEELIKAGNRAFGLTKQLLAFGRRQTVALLDININVMIEETMTILRRLIPEDVEVEFFPSDQEAWVRSDAAHLEQILMNLCLNARDAIPAAGRITISTHLVEIGPQYSKHQFQLVPGSYVTLSITDTGIGMSKETLAHVFEPYFTTKPKERGTGLGLATVYGIVKQTGGDIFVYSELGVGSTFKVYLPQGHKATAPKEETIANRASAQKATILVVEDEDIVRRVITRLLKKNGYNVLEAPSGAEALNLLKNFTGQLDLLLTDVVMPKMNGRELVQRLTAKYRSMKVLYMSGYPEDVIAKRGILDNGISFIDKSVLPSSLLEKIHKTLQQTAFAEK